MRGVLVVLVIASVFLTSCMVQSSPGETFQDVNQFNQVKIIDFPFEELDATEIELLHIAYENENKALSLYRKTLDLFPAEQPFDSVLYRQELQIGLLEEVYTKYELSFPKNNNWYLNVTRFKDPSEACSAAIVFSEQSIHFYDDALDNVGLNYKIDNQDMRFLFEKYRNDYERILIPQFKRCGRGLI